MRIGYARVSTIEQNLDRQIKDLNEKGCEKIYCDKKSGKDFDREQYQEMIANLKEGDILYIHSLDRLGRDYAGIKEEWEKIVKEIKADIIVSDMPLLDTTKNKDLLGTLISDIILSLLSYVAQSERERIRQRQKEGIAIAKEKGVYTGRKKGTTKAIDKDLYEKWLPDFKAGMITGQEFANILNISRSKLYKVMGEM